MIGYKTFKNEGVFLEWQETHPNYGVVSITPIIDTIKAKFSENDNAHTEGDMHTDIKVFVTYIIKEEVPK